MPQARKSLGLSFAVGAPDAATNPDPNPNPNPDLNPNFNPNLSPSPYPDPNPSPNLTLTTLWQGPAGGRGQGALVEAT